MLNTFLTVKNSNAALRNPKLAVNNANSTVIYLCAFYLITERLNDSRLFAVTFKQTINGL